MKTGTLLAQIAWPKTPAVRLSALPAAKLLLPLLLAAALPAAVEGQFICATNNGSITIISYTGNQSAVTIPSATNGLPVTSIGNNVFSSHATLTSVTIPNSVTNIGDQAFYNCTNLTGITIPNSVLNIGDGAFLWCLRLASVTIPASVDRIGDGAFAACTNLSAITVDANNAFYSSADGILFDKSQTSFIQCPAGRAGVYTVPGSVTNIASSAFYSCARLANVTLLDNVTSMGNSVFYNCVGLTNISIPGSIPNIGDYAFYNCSGLANFAIPGSVARIGSHAFDGCSLRNLIIPGGVTDLGDHAFYNCASLTNVTIPDSVTNIGTCAFGWCAQLTNLTIPAGVASIGDQTFYHCAKLTGILLPNSITNIGNNAFDGCASLSQITIPTNVSSIGDQVFYNCANLASITMPNSVTSIGSSVFGRCANLTSVAIPTNVISIGEWAFSDCVNLTSATIPDSVVSLGNGAFYNCSKLTSVTISTNVASIGDATFYSCAGLTNVLIPNSVTSIGAQAFYSCSKLASLTIPPSVTSIGSWAFYACSKLTSVTIPNSVARIGDAMFYSCTGLTSITIPSAISRIGDYTFYGCNNLTKVYFIGNAPELGLSVFTGASKALIYYLPETAANWLATFGGCPTVRNLVPYTYGTTNKAITINGYVGAGGSVIVPSAIDGLPVVSIGDQAFAACATLTNVSIPDCVTNIGSGAFGGCANLLDVYCRGNAPGAGSLVFLGDDKATVYYLSGATGWGTNFSGRPLVMWVPALPNITSQPRDVALVHGVDAGFHATARGGRGSLSYRWLKNGVPLAEDAHISGTASDTLVIHQARLQDKGSYSVVVTKGLSDVSSRSASLTVVADAPRLRIDLPRFNQRISNNVFLVSVSGIASDRLGIGSLRLSVSSNSWVAATADSFTNWSMAVGLVPGINWIVAQAQDLDGTTTLVSNRVLYVVSDVLSATAVSGGAARYDLISPHYDGTMLELGRTYGVTAQRWSGCVFSNWTCAGEVLTNSSTLRFVMRAGLALQANYTDLVRPALRFNASTNYSQWGYSSMDIGGVASDNVQVTAVYCKVNSGNWALARGTVNWTANVGLAYGDNTVYAYAQDAAGNHSLTNAVRVVYNPFLPVSGSYYGLYSTSNRLHGSSGLLGLTVGKNGSYSGYLLGDGRSNRLSGAFDPYGNSVKTLTRAGTNPMTLSMMLNLTNPFPGTVSGTVSNASWLANLWADRAGFDAATNPAPFAGRYTLVIPNAAVADPAVPGGCGYAAASVNANGAVVVSGYLADGTAFSQRAVVSQDGRWPLYASLYGGKGSVYGWLYFTRTPPTDLLGGAFSWIKPALGASAKYYPLGFTLTNEVVGSRYDAPLYAGIRAIAMTNGIACFAEGNLLASFTNNIVLTPNNLIANASTNKLTFSLTPSSGLFSGTVAVPGTKTTSVFKGALLQNRNGGCGYFLGTNQSGSVSLSSAP